MKKIKPAKKAKAKVELKQYHLVIEMNGEVFECDTNDLKESILEFKPLVVKTKVIFKITKGDLYCEKIVFVRRARMIFRKNLFMKIFLNQLIFK